MNGQNPKSAEAKKSNGWAWQELIIAILAVACILFSTVIAAPGVDAPSAASPPRAPTHRPTARPTVHDAVISALSAAADDLAWNKIKEEGRWLGTGLCYRLNMYTPPSLGSMVANTERPLAAVFDPILRTVR
jgi:hypothetical protein